MPALRVVRYQDGCRQLETSLAHRLEVPVVLLNYLLGSLFLSAPPAQITAASLLDDRHDGELALTLLARLYDPQVVAAPRALEFDSDDSADLVNHPVPFAAPVTAVYLLDRLRGQELPLL